MAEPAYEDPIITEIGRCKAREGTFVSQIRDLRGALGRLLTATAVFSDQRRAAWWVQGSLALRRTRGAQNDA